MKFWTLQWNKKRWLVLVLVLGLGWLGYVLVLNLMVVSVTHDIDLRSPATELMPTPLPTSKLADMAVGSTVSAFGYTVRVPWVKLKDSTTATFFKTDDGSTMVILDPAAEVDAREIYKTSPQMERLLGQREMSSRYQLFQAAMVSSPKQVRLWHTHTVNVRAMVLLNMKSMFVLDWTSAIHSIAGQHVHGFEAVATKKGRMIVHLELFDDEDRELELMLSWTPGKASALTQEQINAIVASVQIPMQGCTTPRECS